MKILDALEPKTRRFIEALAKKGAQPINKMSIENARNVLDSLQSEPVDKLAVRIEDSTIPTKDGNISIRIVRPQNNHNSKLPVIMYFHGGGWILGNKNTHDRLVREIAMGANAAVVFVNYTPSPEARYPVAIEQAYTATKYIADKGESLNLDSGHLAVAGDSVGGNMATVVTLMAKERKGPKIAQQILFYPVTDAHFETASYKRFTRGPWLTKAAMKWFWDAYEPNIANRKKPTISPLRASIEQLRGLPPALIITCENDVLRDEGEAYAHKLMQAGVEVTSVRCLGTMHDFLMLNPLSTIPAVHSTILLTSATLQKAFANQKTARTKNIA